MHISEGVLSPPVLVTGWVIAGAGLGMGLRRITIEDMPRTATVSAVLFLASLIHVPVGPSSIHLTLLGLAGILLGWGAVPALFITLLLQGLLFQFGGILSLGVNTTVMGTAALTGYGVYRLVKRPAMGALLAGGCAILAGSALVVAALCGSHGNIQTTAGLIFAANVPLALVEGVITLGIVLFLKKTPFMQSWLKTSWI